MITQYKHIATVQTTETATRDGNGNWVTPEPGDPVEFSCRAEPQSGNGYVQGTDGAKVNFNWIVYCLQDVADIPVGSSIAVIDGEDLILTDTVKRFSRGQLNARIWL